MCQIPGILLWCQGMCFIFSLCLLYSHHELIRMMLLHTRGPCGKSCESDRPALQGKKKKSRAGQSSAPTLFPALVFFSRTFDPSSCMNLTSPRPSDLCSVLMGPTNQLLLTHGGENRATAFGLKHQTHSTQEVATFVSQRRRRKVLEDYNGSESDTLNSHSVEALFSLWCNDWIRLQLVISQNSLNVGWIAQQI